MSSEVKEEKVTRELIPPPDVEAEMRRYVERARVVTPQSLAIKFGIRVSTARKMLRRYAEEGLVFYVDGNSRLRIYSGAKAGRTPERRGGSDDNA